MLVAFSISFIIGYLTIRLILNKNIGLSARNDFYMHLVLSLPFGLGISSLVSFYSILFFDKIDRVPIFVGHFILLLILLIINIKKESLSRDIQIIRLSLINFRWLIMVLFLSFFVIFCAIPDFLTYPFGFWDAIACWNLKARLLFNSDNWTKLFSPLLIRSEYPILLPLTIIWGWLLSGNDILTCPILISIIYSFLTIFFILLSVSRYYEPKKSFLMALFFVNIPGFFDIIASQYADIVLACYNLIGIVSCFIGARERRKDYMILGEVSLSFSLFAKDEGLLFFVCANIIMFLYFLIKNRQFLKIFWQAVSASLFSLTTLIIFKGLIPVSSKAFFLKGLSLSLFYNKTLDFLSFTYKNILRLSFDNSLFYLLLIFITLFYKEIFKVERLIISFTLILVFIGYFIVFFLSGTNTIIDHLLFTAPRLAFHLIPALCFVIADIIFEKN